MPRLKSCHYCGRIHRTDIDCGRKPKARQRYKRSEAVSGRYTGSWKNKSREIREDAHYLCQWHMMQGELVYEELEVHHIIPLEVWPEGLLVNENLICLCRDCHEKAERGEIGAEALRKLAEERERRAKGP